MSNFVLVLMYILAIVAWPTAKLLDWLLGEDHGTMYKKSGLKTLVSLHRSMGESGQRLHADEVTIISAVLDLKEKTVGSIMTPMDDVFTLSLDDVLDEEMMDDILSQGYSRIPVHHPDNDENFIGMLLVKMLITYDPEDAKPVREFALATLPETREDTSCLDIVNFFQEGKSHMVLVSHHPGEDHGAIGVCTLEDVIEELIGEEIVDESDVFIDVHKAIRRSKPAPRSRLPRMPSDIKQQPLKPAVTDLVDISEDQTLDASEIQRQKSQDGDIPKAQASQVAMAGPRRLSGNSIDPKPRHRGNVDDVKEHLKHLGPSNLASRPKTTRYASVKIKPGQDNTVARPPGTNGRMEPIRRISEANSEFNAGIGEGLLRSAGKDASDGVQVLRQDYGAMSTSPTNRRPTSASKAVQVDDGVDPDASSKNEPTSRPPPRTEDSHDTLSDLPNRPRSPYYARGPARSGSITENVVDSNGIRKVVLQTTSSSESDDEEENSGAKPAGENGSRSEDATSNTADATNIGGEHLEASGNKKRRRRKKRNPQSKNSETEPLLGGQK